MKEITPVIKSVYDSSGHYLGFVSGTESDGYRVKAGVQQWRRMAEPARIFQTLEAAEHHVRILSVKSEIKIKIERRNP